MPIIGILRGLSGDLILSIAEVYARAGFSTLEVTMNTPGAPQIISRLRHQFPGLNIGAGTVCTFNDLVEAKNSGASFIVTPIIDEAVIKTCKADGVPIFPGAYTPSEIFKAWQLGASAVKVFPATQLGVSFLKDIAAPLSDVRFLPTGGVSIENISSYFEAGVLGVGMGSSLFPRELLFSRNFKALEEHLDLVRQEVNPFLT